MYRSIAATLLMLSLCVSTHGEAQETIFKDCAECPEMVIVPTGEFVMGADQVEETREHLTDEFRNRSMPLRRVKVGRFALGRYEVTIGQYRAFAEATGRGSEGCFAWLGGEYRMDSERSWRNPGFAQDDKHPVTCISWEDASAYVQWLSLKFGRQYRLPSEAEWEYAARAGSPTSRFWGENGENSCTYANGADQSALALIAEARNWSISTCADGYAYTAPVGSFRANAFGLYDMLGNAAEWTADCWNGDYQGAPIDGRVWAAGDCGLRAVRGGAWDDSPAGLRSAYRVGSPVVVRVYARGFRVAAQN
jgi:formylglycine-generating enzyme required for sulfatase activity